MPRLRAPDRQLLGQCVECNKPPTADTVRCETHRVAHNLRVKLWKETRANLVTSHSQEHHNIVGKRRDHRKPGKCKECGTKTSEVRFARCRPCYNMYAPPPGQPADPAGYAEETERLKKVDAKLLAKGRCKVCELMLPCGGHESIADYANMRRETV